MHEFRMMPRYTEARLQAQHALDFNRMRRTHLLTAEAGNAALRSKHRLAVFDLDDMRRAAFRALSAAHALIFADLSV